MTKRKLPKYIHETVVRGTPKYYYSITVDRQRHRGFYPHDDDGLAVAIRDYEAILQAKKDGIKGTPDNLEKTIICFLQTYKKGKIKDSSYNRNIDTLYTIPPTLLHKRIDSITADDIQDALNAIQDMISYNAALKAYDIINSALKNAVNNDRIRKNPCMSINRPTYSPKEKDIFTKEEVMRMFRAIRYIRSNGTYHSIKHDYFSLYMFLLHTGTRINEALGARWEDITWTEGKEEIYIQRTIDSHAPHQTASTPKTTAGRRHIPLSKRLLRRLKKLRPNGEVSKGYIFATATGNALGYHNAWKTWDAIGRECARECPSCHEKRPNGWTCSHGHHVNRRGLKCRECGEERPEEWTCPTCGTLVREIHKSFHSTRHTFCSFLVNAGVPITTVQYLAGHASSTVTLDTYSHKAENYRDVLEEKLYGTKEPDTKQ